MPSEDINILEFNQYQQSDKVLFLLENTDGCKLILKIHPQQKLNLNKKKLNLSTIEQQESYKIAKICYICKEKFENKYMRDKKYCNLKYSVA